MILSWLEVKYLLRCESVCKAWNAALVKNREFIDMLALHNGFRLHNGLRFHIIEHDAIIFTIRRFDPQRRMAKRKLRYLSPFSCRGLLVEGLCRASSLRTNYWLPATKYRICNPAIKRVLDLPLPHEGVIVMRIFLNSATNSYNVVSLYSDRLEKKVNFEILDLGCQSTDPCPDENLSWRTLDIPGYDEANRLQEYDGKRCVMEEAGILLMPALHNVESGNAVILCVDLVHQACTTLNAPHTLSLEYREINLQLWRGKPALSFVSEEKLNVCILEDYKTQTWGDTILIPLPNLNNAIPRVKKQIPQIYQRDEEDFLVYTDDFYTNGIKGYRVCKTGSEELIFAPTPPPTRVPATLVSLKGMRPQKKKQLNKSILSH
ncbi:hypothetical protein ACET3Z_029261 [Daucus carota]